MTNLSADDQGRGFAFFRLQAFRPWWVINIANYGAVLFEGAEDDAEEQRKLWANREQCIAHKRPASVTDFGRPSACWNHPGFARVYRTQRGRPFFPRFHCDCGGCVNG